MSDTRVAWIAEDSAEDDFLLAPARFSGYIDLGPGERVEGAALDEALRWARARAAMVLVRLWDSDYLSAGERNPDSERFAQWPAEGLRVRPRRPRGLEVLDNTEAAPPGFGIFACIRTRVWTRPAFERWWRRICGRRRYRRVRAIFGLTGCGRWCARAPRRRPRRSPRSCLVPHTARRARQRRRRSVLDAQLGGLPVRSGRSGRVRSFATPE